MLTRLKYYLRIILRLAWKYKTRTMVGLFGLVFGLACLVPATYWLRYETSYDSAYPDADRLYRVYTYDKEAGKDNELVSGILSRELGERIPALANSTLFFIEPTDYKTASEPFVRLRTLFTDSTFLKVFPQRFIAGDAYAPLAVENRIVLTESVAKRLYGGAEAAVGQSLQSIGLTQSDPPYTVVAVVKDPPRATNLPFDAFLAHNQISLQKNYADASGKAIWSFATLRMYVRLPEGADPEELTERARLFPAEAHANKALEVRLLPIADERYRLDSDVMGLENPIGMTINLPYMGKESDFRIVGVVGDCHLYSLRSHILPTLFYNSPFPTNTFYLRVADGQEQAAIRWLNERLPRIHPAFAAIEPTPLSVLYDRLGASERAGLRLFAVLAAVSLLVSLFGIYAVASSATRQRRKEIAIRKVFGAGTGQVIALFTREFLLLTLLSGLIALPVAYAILLHWLRGYAYRIAIPWWLPVGILALIAALVTLTVLGQVRKAANGNPAEVVRSE